MSGLEPPASPGGPGPTPPVAAAQFRVRGVVQGVGFRPFVYGLARRCGADRLGAQHLGRRRDHRRGRGGRRREHSPPPYRSEAPERAFIASLERLPAEPTGAAQFAHPRERRGLRAPTSSSRPTSRSARTADASCSIRPTGATAIPSSTARTAALASRSSSPCRTTASARRCAPSRSATTAGANIATRPTAASTPSRSRARSAGPTSSCGGEARKGSESPAGLAAPAAEPVAERDEALELAGRLLREGAIVAVKGLGGFHLACDATDGEAVRELKRRKGRPHKPLAVMVADLEELARHCPVDAAEEGCWLRRSIPSCSWAGRLGPTAS